MSSERTRSQPARKAGYTRHPTILASKVRRLAGPSRVCVRARLLPTPEELAGTRLFLLKALAGYGKTTLVRQYAELAENLGVHTAWLRLDAADNEPTKALAYLVAAFAELDPAIGSEMAVFTSALPPLPAADILAELICRIERRGSDVLLLVDDYHTITDSGVHELMYYFLRNLPASVHVAVATRHMPPWDLDEIAHGGPVRVYDEADIRFSVEEAADYLEAFHGLRLEAEDLRAVHRRTDGWISAIKLVSHALDKRGGRLAAAHLEPGANRGLIDYLASAVFDRLDWETQEFLLLTAPLERLCPSLCDAVTGGNNARAMIDKLVAANLFVEPLDAVGLWYRYHSLFSKFLIDRLGKQPAIDRVALHRRASFWFEVNRQPHAAAEHAMAAGDASRQAALIEAAILDLVRGSQISLAMSWFDTLPPEFSETKPDVLIPMAWCNIYLGRTQGGRDLIARVKHLLQDAPERLGPADLRRRDEFLLEVELAETDLRRSSYGELPDIRRLQAAKDRLSPQWDFLRAYLELMFCHAYIAQDLLDTAFAAASEAVVYAKRVPNAFVANLALERLAQIRYLQGRLGEARSLCEDAIQRAYGPGGEPLPVVGHFHLLLAKLHYESNDLALSRQHLDAAKHLTPLNNSPDIRCETEILAARCLAAEAGPERAIAALINHNNRELDLGAPLSIRRVRAYQAWFETAAGGLRAAEGVLAQMGASLGRAGPPATLAVSPLAEFEHVALCRYLIAAGKPDVAVNWLRHLLRLAERSGRLRSCIALNGLLALAQSERGQPEAALRHVREMLALGEHGGFARTIVDLGPELVPLLREYEARLPHGGGRERSEYVGRLLRMARGEGGVLAAAAPQPNRPVPQEAPAGLADVDALTRREVQILEMISEGRRNREVADELLIAESSVRWHVRNVYAKLGVHNRTEASAKGRSLKLIH